MRHMLLAGTLLALSGCATLEANRARTHLVGAAEPDIIACMGVPAERQLISRTQSVLQWDYAQAGDDVDLEAGIYEVKLGRPGICHAIIRISGGYVQSVHYTGEVVTATDPDSICNRLIHDCLWHREHTPLPAGFSQAEVAGGK